MISSRRRRHRNPTPDFEFLLYFSFCLKAEFFFVTTGSVFAEYDQQVELYSAPADSESLYGDRCKVSATQSETSVSMADLDQWSKFVFTINWFIDGKILTFDQLHCSINEDRHLVEFWFGKKLTTS